MWALASFAVTGGNSIYSAEAAKAVSLDAACHTSIALVDEAGVDASQTRVLIHQAEKIWRAEGVTLSWLQDTRTGGGALTVILQQRRLGKITGPSAAWRHVLGSIPVTDGQGMSRITVSVDSVRSLLIDAVVQGRPLAQRPLRLQQDLVAQALGRVVAHEIGHYRLRFYGHTATGLMRAVFSTEDLLDREVSRFRLERSLFRPWLGTTASGEGIDCRR